MDAPHKYGVAAWLLGRVNANARCKSDLLVLRPGHADERRLTRADELELTRI